MPWCGDGCERVRRHRRGRRGGTLTGEIVRERKRKEKGGDVLGPTPLKSSLSMTSAWTEPFLPRGFAFAFSRALAACRTES